MRLADTNEVANFNIDGTGSAAGVAGIFSPGTGAGNPNIHDIDMSNVTGTGIQFTPLSRDNTNTALKTVAGNVTIDSVNFRTWLASRSTSIRTSTDVTDPNVTLQETIAISNVDSQNGSDEGMCPAEYARRPHGDDHQLHERHGRHGGLGRRHAATGVLVFQASGGNTFDGNVTLTNLDIFANAGYALDFDDIDANSAFSITSGNGLTWNGRAGTAGGMRFTNFNGTITGNSSTLTNGTLDVQIAGASDGTFTFANTVTFTNVGGGGSTSTAARRTSSLAPPPSPATSRTTPATVSIQGMSGRAPRSRSPATSPKLRSASQGILDSNAGGTLLSPAILRRT